MHSNNKIVATSAEGMAHLLLNKPAKLNALDEEMLLEIERQFGEWERSPAITVVILASTSERAFCVGADIEVLSRFDEQAMRAWELLGSRVLDRIQSSPLISIASIGGHALGGGLTLAAACDFRIASTNATFSQPEIDLGWVPGWSGVARLVSLVGAVQAKHLCMAASRITTPEAKAIGLVNLVAEQAQLAQKTDEFAKGLAARSPAALQAIKSLTGHAASGTPDHFFDAFLNAALLNNEGGQAAIAKFLAKKK
jgi:enoyl-CoA hydratase